jgi:glucose-1-phosphate thymidylyltransferase
MRRKGIILAGGAGSRLHPITLAVSKQLLPVFDKPMIYYPLSTLMLAGVQDVLLISTPDDTPRFQQLLGDGSNWGIRISYAIQPSPDGLAQAFIIGEEFLAGSPSILVLGDNLFYGHALPDLLASADRRKSGGTVFAYHVTDPERYGVAELTPDNQVIDIVEKPVEPKSNFAVTGLYYYDEHAPKYAKQLKPSKRGELEITDLNRVYLERGELGAEVFGRGFAWFDTGTHESLLEAGQFIATLEHRQGLKIACLEEIAYLKNWISRAQLESAAQGYSKSSYGKYLRAILDEGRFR